MKDIAIRLGSVKDSYEHLRSLTEKKARGLVEKIDLDKGETVEVPVWTADIPELIAVVTFERDKTGVVEYTIDDTMSTL